MSTPNDKQPAESQNDHVTYVVVVHGMGEQRKNECVINVVNRFAEARRDAREDDNRDVLTLGKASSQTGWSKAPDTEQPWIEFDGIPASPDCDRDLPPFLGEMPKDPGANLRFVDVCWSDVTHDSFRHVGQDVHLWAKGLVSRLLRKHEAAVSGNEPDAQVPLWIRRVLYVLADTLLLVRFAMRFRFKEMNELVFVKFLGDAQLYGEYDRCRGQAVRRFHELMARIEAAHEECERRREEPRKARYAVIAHSLGSIMSLDALLYASAKPHVRRGDDDVWEFPGYLRDDDKSREPDELAKLDRLRQKSRTTSGDLSPEEKCDLRKLEKKFAFLDTCWVHRVRSFVTLGSPIDKYLTLWWTNYRYLLECKGRLQPRDRRILHFNYCDEADPVGHNLDVVQKTPVYDAVFRSCEDVVFNRYSIPGAAHNKYWTDQRLFRWILHRAVDKDDGNAAKAPERPRWFRRKAYWWLLFWLYVLVPILVLFGTHASLSLALQVDGWRTAALSAVIFSFLVYFGHRLIDLSIWWRQIQRQMSRTFWAGRSPKNSYRKARRRAGTAFRALVAALPVVLAAQTTLISQALTDQRSPGEPMPLWLALTGAWMAEDRPARLSLVGGLLAITIVAQFLLPHLPKAYRTQVRVRRKAEAMLVAAGCIAAGVGVTLHPVSLPFPLLPVPDSWVATLAPFSAVATLVSAYCLYRLLVVKTLLHSARPQTIRFKGYARRRALRANAPHSRAGHAGRQASEPR